MSWLVNLKLEYDIQYNHFLDRLSFLQPRAFFGGKTRPENMINWFQNAERH